MGHVDWIFYGCSSGCRRMLQMGHATQGISKQHVFNKVIWLIHPWKQVFGKRLIDQPVIRAKLAKMASVTLYGCVSWTCADMQYPYRLPVSKVLTVGSRISHIKCATWITESNLKSWQVLLHCANTRYNHILRTWYMRTNQYWMWITGDTYATRSCWRISSNLWRTWYHANRYGTQHWIAQQNIQVLGHFGWIRRNHGRSWCTSSNEEVPQRCTSLKQYSTTLWAYDMKYSRRISHTFVHSNTSCNEYNLLSIDIHYFWSKWQWMLFILEKNAYKL